MTKPIVVEPVEDAEGVVKIDVDTWKRGPSVRNEPYIHDERRRVPDEPVDLQINEDGNS